MEKVAQSLCAGINVWAANTYAANFWQWDGGAGCLWTKYTASWLLYFAAQSIR